MLIQHGGQHEPRAIYFRQYLALQLVGGEGDFDILVLVPHSCGVAVGAFDRMFLLCDAMMVFILGIHE